MITAAQSKELETLALPLVKWVNDNMHPHAKIIIETTSFELVEGVIGQHTTEFVKD